MKRIILSFILFIIIGVKGVQAQTVLEHPYIEVTNSGIINISKIELNKNETRIHIHSTFIPRWWVKFSKKDYIQDVDTGEKYHPISMENGDFDTEIFMSESGDSTFVFIYPELPPSARRINYASDDGNDPAFIGGISLDPSESKKKKTTEVPAEIRQWLSKEVAASEYKTLVIADKKNFFHKGIARIVGYIKGYDVRLNLRSGMIYADNEITREDHPTMVEIEPDGRFEVNVPINHPVCSYISFGRKGNIDIYLEPGRTLALILDWADFLDADRYRNAPPKFERLAFEGPTAELNRKLSTAKPDFSSYYKSFEDDVKSMIPIDFKNKYLADWQKMQAHYSQREDLTDWAKRIIQNEISAFFAEKLISYVNRREYMLRNEPDNEILKTPVPESYYDFLAAVPMTDKTLLAVPDFSSFINRLEYMKPFSDATNGLYARQENFYAYLIRNGVELTADESTLRTVQDSISQLYQEGKEAEVQNRIRETNVEERWNHFFKKHEAHYNNWIENIKAQAFEVRKKSISLKDSILNHYAKQDVSLIADIIKARSAKYISGTKTLSKDEKAYLDYLHNGIKDPFIHNELTLAIKERYGDKSKGYDLPEGKATDIFRNIVDKHSGKILLIDFWESWCAPCVNGIKTMKETREKYKDNERVDFIFICSEDTPNDYYVNFSKEQEMINSYRITENEYLHLRQLFKFNGIPRYILISSEGKVLEDNFSIYSFEGKLNSIPPPAAQPPSSPNGALTLRHNKNEDQSLSFTVAYADKKVLTIPLVGMSTEKGRGEELKFERIIGPRAIQENYVMQSGKRRECSNEANEYIYLFSDKHDREFRINFRLYNDGIAFRYELQGLEQDAIAAELTTYRIAEGIKRWMQKYDVSYEDFYPETTSGEGENRHWAYPALIQTENEVWAMLSEAGIERQHSASSLKNEYSAADYKVCPATNEQRITGNWVSPWRVVIVGTLADVVESTLITDVSPPCPWEDTGWIRPGSVSWIYWAYNRGSKDFRIVKAYIDMAVQLKLPYVLIDWEWDVMANGGNIDDALEYAAERDVRILLWYNSSTAWTTNGAGGPLFKLNAPEDREKEFAWLQQKGVAGVKIDFFSGDTQETMDYCLDLLESAARHKLLVNFHGATIPRGWQRTYPNLMTVEGVYGAEWYNNRPTLTDRAAAHNATLPFTRNVIGSMDYTPCTFSDSQHPHITTHAHELALAVVFESALLHWADRPESYLAQPEKVKTFMSELPSAWDETRLVSGYPGDHVVLARRKGETWYIGGLNGSDKDMTLDMDWSFLGEGEYRLIMYKDSDNKEEPWDISVEERSTDRMPDKILCSPRGGFVAVCLKISL